MEGPLSAVLSQLGRLLMDEYNLQKSVRGDIMFLKTELEFMQDALLKISDAPMHQQLDNGVKNWANRVRELSYEIEDTIDTIMVRIHAAPNDEQHSFRGFIDRSISVLKEAKIRHKVGNDIKDIKVKVKELSESRSRYNVDSVVARPTETISRSISIDRHRQFDIHKKVTELFATKEKIDDLSKRLMVDQGDDEVSKQLKIVSIVGVGGLGKSTLANLVYEKLKNEFDCAAFVSVSLNPNWENIYKSMLQQLGKYKSMSEAPSDAALLVRELGEFLRNKRYMIVIDDIWKELDWEIIKNTLNKCEYGSGIITTTRIHDVARTVGGVYELEFLSPDDSRKLFYQRIYGNEEERPPGHLAEVAEKFLKKSGGVPLAILTIASVLANNIGKENIHRHWNKVHQSLGYALEDCPHVEKMRRILSISYYDLKPQLRTCLLYLTLFPEDHDIQVEDLIWRWIGEGFVPKEQYKSLYETGEAYFNELINSSMIQPNTRYGNKTSSCRVHDMVLDLISSLSNEENFLTSLGGQLPKSSTDKIIRRLSLQTNNKENAKLLSTRSLSHVRSLTVFPEAFGLLTALSSFPLLRVLNLEGCSHVRDEHCKPIFSLFHLRYLWLRMTSISEIPEEIGNLRFLEVFNIRHTDVEQLPSTFVHLERLVFLSLPNQPCNEPRLYYQKQPNLVLPDGFGNLSFLQYLSPVCIFSKTMLHDLSRLTMLRSLDLIFKEIDESYGEAFTRCLCKLVNLERLSVECLVLNSQCDELSPGPHQLWSFETEGCTIYQLPRWITSQTCLTKLQIEYLVNIGVEDLRVLGSMPYLCDLQIALKNSIREEGEEQISKENEGGHKRLVIDSGCPFRCLTNFTLHGNIDITMAIAEGAMQKLEFLSIDLRLFPAEYEVEGDLDFGLKNLSSLKHALIELHCSHGVKIEKRKATEDAIRKAVAMIPSQPTLDLRQTYWTIDG